jgi:hypothetical protein
VDEDPSQIREEIEATRERMTETADALATKANMRARAKEQVQARRDALLARVRAVAPQSREQAIGQAHAAQQALAGRARGLAQNPQQAVDSARSAALAAKQQPPWVALACGVVALLGLRKIRRSRTSRPPPKAARTGNDARRALGRTTKAGVRSGRR